MSFMNKTISFLAVFSVLPAANALTARPSIVTAATNRMPTMSVRLQGTTVGTTTSSSSTAALLENAECIDSYTACMRGADACGSDFEECTTKVLFHGKMPMCLSTLAQCNSAGVTSLFGVGNTTALNTVATKNSYGEVTDYTYPTDGSVLGQIITGAAISNKYDTSTCVKRYTSCLKKDTVCGNDFELCTTDKEFRKQRVFCDSTLARCQSAGVIELFGSNSLSVSPSATSRVGELIAEGASLAAVNAVSTCYKVVDQCILGACSANPYRCNENSVRSIATLVDSINNGNASTDAKVEISDMISKSEISSYIRNECRDTIGSNKYCYATFIGNGQMPTASQLKDEDNQAEIFDEAYNARMNSGMRAKIADLMDSFDTKAKEKCVETISACAMRTCGSGSGAACYSQVFGAKDKSINNDVSRNEIKIGCEAIVNTDAYCKYAAANPNATGSYSYSYINSSAFDTLFPEYNSVGTNNDPIAVISKLNAALATNYSDAALATMKKQCQAVATSCVRSLCGADYENCYRNRTDVYSSITNTGDATFDRSMNKVGGVLDYTTALGLCLDTVKNASVCEEHLAIEQNKLKIANSKTTNSWGDATSVRGGWIDAGRATQVTAQTDSIQETDENGNKLCSSRTGDQGVCYSVDAAGNVYDTPVMISYTSYYQNQAASTLFRDLIYDLEKEAQAKYNAKLTREQSVCLAQNSGGIMGARDMGSAFTWVKLKSNKVPKNYSTSGLKSNQFVASNDIYGSFCLARVTLQSDDKRIQDVLNKGKDWSTAYFAVGDVFTCGSWIPSKDLESIAKAVASDAISDKKKQYSRERDWYTLLGTTLGGIGGANLVSGLANGKIASNLTGISDKSEKVDYLENCATQANLAATTTSDSTVTSAASNALMAANNAYKMKKDAELESAITELRNAMYNQYEDKTTNVAVSDTDKARALQKMIGKLAAECDSNKKVCGNYPITDNINIYTVQETARGIQRNHATCHDSCNNSNNCKNSCDDNYSLAGRVISIIDTYEIEIKDKTSTSKGTDQKIAAVRSAAGKLASKCMALGGETTKKEKNTKWISSSIGAVGGAVAGGILVNKAAKDIQQATLDAQYTAAYQEFMDQVGSHISCYIGGEEAGNMNDVIQLEVE